MPLSIHLLLVKAKARRSSTDRQQQLTSCVPLRAFQLISSQLSSFPSRNPSLSFVQLFTLFTRFTRFLFGNTKNCPAIYGVYFRKREGDTERDRERGRQGELLARSSCCRLRVGFDMRLPGCCFCARPSCSPLPLAAPLECTSAAASPTFQKPLSQIKMRVTLKICSSTELSCGFSSQKVSQGRG